MQFRFKKSRVPCRLINQQKCNSPAYKTENGQPFIDFPLFFALTYSLHRDFLIRTRSFIPPALAAQVDPFQNMNTQDGLPPETTGRRSINEFVMAHHYSEASARISLILERKGKGVDAEAQKLDDLKKELEMWEHKVSVEELCRRVGTDPDNGLSPKEADNRLARDGPNVLSPPKVIPWYIKLLKQFGNFFAILLQVGSCLCFLSFILNHENDENLYLGIVLYAVVIITAIFTYFQEAKSEKTMEKFKNMLPPKTLVCRDGVLNEIDAADLVVGDVIEVKLGDKVPADIRLIDSQKFKVDNSPLTGESEPVSRTVQCTNENPLETSNLAFFGTLAVDGTCRGVVVTTGDETLFGRIAGLAARSTTEITTLQVDIHHFVVIISSFAIFFGVFFFCYGLIKGTPILTNIVFAIGLIVANVPEGLLATVTLSLTLSAKRLAKKNVLVKKLECVETLGSTTCICSDKTGTLTQNRMTIVHVCYDEDLHTTKTAATDATFNTEDPCFKELFFVASVCGKAMFDVKDMEENPDKSIDERKVIGDASEAGILKFCHKISPVDESRFSNPQVATIPFNSANKFMVTINGVAEKKGSLRVCIKGAPERIIERCTSILRSTGVEPFNDMSKKVINDHLSYMMEQGERCLGFAMLDLDPASYPPNFAFDTEDVNFPLTGLVFVGMMALLDPPREAVPDAVLTCQQAGVKVIMVTGDHPATAKAIAKQVNIIKDPTRDEVAKLRGISISDVDDTAVKSIVVTGSEIGALETDDWDRILAHEQIVFARTSPQQKLLIVENNQRLGNVVAVTGDGVNDSPALKKANIGVAMGIAGSDVSKEAADMILLDDNFASIVSGVEEGRLIFDNLKKSIAYTLTHNPPEISPFLAYIVLNIPAPLTTVLILCIDLGTDIVPAISLAYENPELDIMKRPPRNAKKDRMVNSRIISFAYLQIGIIQSVAGFFTYFVVWYDFGVSPSILINLDKQSYINSVFAEDKRWMYVRRSRHQGPSYSGGWFRNYSGSSFDKYFTAKQNGFAVQNGEDSEEALKQNRSGIIFDSTLRNDIQRQNMFKILAFELKAPPCVKYSCIKNGVPYSNSYTECVEQAESYESGIIIDNSMLSYDDKADIYHDKESQGTKDGEGCFDLYTVSQVSHVEKSAQTAFFICIVIVQIGGILICKTRTLSLFQQGMKNWVLNLSLCSEIAIACIIAYVPFIQKAFNSQALYFVHWLPAMPFAFFIFTYDELRKFLIRRGDRTGKGFGVWLRRNTYW